VLLGLKQAEVAARAKVSRTTVVKLEQGLFVYAATRAAVERALGIASSLSQPETPRP
jgi:DNA-binding XRE family transcriptional regulator